MENFENSEEFQRLSPENQIEILKRQVRLKNEYIADLRAEKDKYMADMSAELDRQSNLLGSTSKDAAAAFNQVLALREENLALQSRLDELRTAYQQLLSKIGD